MTRLGRQLYHLSHWDSVSLSAEARLMANCPTIVINSWNNCVGESRHSASFSPSIPFGSIPLFSVLFPSALYRSVPFRSVRRAKSVGGDLTGGRRGSKELKRSISTRQLGETSMACLTGCDISRSVVFWESGLASRTDSEPPPSSNGIAAVFAQRRALCMAWCQ